MGRLIDADALLDRISLNYNNHQNITAGAMKDMINTTPTAYNVEKVVAELEEKAQDYRDRRIHHQTIGNLDNAVAFGHKEDAVRKSIIIVKRGRTE